MEEEFNLSERRRIFKEGEEIWTDGTNEILLVEDVKEFIKRLKEELTDKEFIGMWQSMRIFQVQEQIKYVIDKLAGDKLNGNTKIT